MSLVRHRYSPDFLALNSKLNGAPLPFIKGTQYYVDPLSGSNSRDGLSIAEAVADLPTAYDRCTSGAGDGIVVLSGGTGTSSQTTSYLKQPIAWTKHGITVVGVAAPTQMFSRARVSNLEVTTPANTTISHAANSITRETGSFLADGWVAGMTGKTVDSGSNNGATFTIVTATALVLTISETFNVQAKATVGSCVMTSYVSQLLNVSGSNNVFLNLHLFNGSSHALSLGALKVSGARNFFGGCHIVGGGHATPAAVATCSDLWLAGAEENTFDSCTFGTDTIIRAATNGNLRLSGLTKRTQFFNCLFTSYSATSTHGMIISDAADSIEYVQTFSRCRFINWTPNGITNLASAFIGVKPTSGQLLMDSCSLMGFTAWDSVGANDTVYVANSNATAAGAGGIATSV